MEYLYSVFGSLLVPIFVLFLVMSVGYGIGAIKVKGISLGSAGVLLAAILVGVLFSFMPTITLGKEIVLWDKSLEKTYKVFSNIGTVLFVTSVGLIAGPKFFRSFNKSMISYVVMGASIILIGVVVTILISWLDKDMNIAMGTGLLSGSLTSTQIGRAHV